MLSTSTDYLIVSAFAVLAYTIPTTRSPDMAFRGRGLRAAEPPVVPRSAMPSPPPLIGGESSSDGAKVDWLTVTFRPSDDEVPGCQGMELLAAYLGSVQGVECPGMFGYAHGVRYFVDVRGTQQHVARLDYGGTFHKGRSRLDLSGLGCSMVTDWAGVSGWIERQCQYTLTRVDLAVDCLRGEFGVDDAVEWYRAGEFNAGGRNPRHSTIGDWLEPHYGRTLEIGKRGNGKMLRAYEKGRQLGDHASPWVRFEVELRNVDRDLPLDVLTRCSEYFVGAYDCLKRVIDSAAERIKCHQAEGDISLEKLCVHARCSYGQTIDCLRLMVSADDLVNFLARPGIPKRLDKASLAGYLKTGSPPAFLKEQCHEDLCNRV